MDDPEFRSFIERVKLAAPIEEVVGRRVSGLKRAGSTWKACCPFHEESTPSFVVTPDRGLWRCFGACSEGGDAISFVQRDSGIGFREAVEELARDYGVELPRGWRGQRGEDPRTAAARQVLERAETFYRRKLLGDEGQAARAYLEGRGLSPEVLEAFGVGFAPTGNELLRSARAGGASEQALVDAGLVRVGDRGPYDFFRGRIMIPIRDALGRTVGFGARLLPGQEGPKYVNTSETKLFQKGRLIYGLDLARPAVRRSRSVVLVEGYTDVMAAHQVDQRNVVAVLGTATTSDHATLVRRSGAQRATLLFDGDEAGRRAAIKALRGLLGVDGLALEVASLPQGMDPCDAFLGDQREALVGRIESGQPWFEYLLEPLVGAPTEVLVEGVGECLELLTLVGDPIEREARLTELASRLGLSRESVRERWEGLKAQRAREASRRTPQPRRDSREASGPPRGPGNGPDRGSVRAESRTGAPVEVPRPEARNPEPAADVEGRWIEARAWGEIGGALLLDNGLISVYRALIETSDEAILRADARIARILSTLLALYEADVEGEEPIDASSVMTALGDDPDRGLVVRLEDHARRAESPRALAEGALETLRKLTSRRRWAEARAQARSADDREVLERADALRREQQAAARDQQDHAGQRSR